jgi:predicted transcriptional regulator of viral defense system
MKKTKTDYLIEKLKAKGILRARDIEALGISRTYLGKLCGSGVVERIGRGMYCLPNAGYSESHSLAEAAKQIPKGVVCLLSALRFHKITTQAPFEVWIAIDFKARKPKVFGAPLRIVRFSGQALHAGIEKHKVYDIEVKVYSVAKTIADCFKYRNKIGLDVAMEALREGWRGKRFTMDQLWRYAKICRVGNVIRPYLESLTSS